MKKMSGKRILILLAVALTLALLPVIASCEEELPEIQNVAISSDGIMTWNAFPGTMQYWISVENKSRATEETKYEINAFIDELIYKNEIEKTGNYALHIQAENSEGNYIAEWKDTYAYQSPAEPIVVGVITSVSSPITRTPERASAGCGPILFF